MEKNNKPRVTGRFFSSPACTDVADHRWSVFGLLNILFVEWNKLHVFSFFFLFASCIFKSLIFSFASSVGLFLCWPVDQAQGSDWPSQALPCVVQPASDCCVFINDCVCDKPSCFGHTNNQDQSASWYLKPRFFAQIFPACVSERNIEFRWWFPKGGSF